MAISNYKYQNLELARKFNNLTVEEMMKKINRNRDTYYRWQESGQISSTDLINLHKLLNVSVDCILGIESLKLVPESVSC